MIKNTERTTKALIERTKKAQKAIAQKATNQTAIPQTMKKKDIEKTTPQPKDKQIEKKRRKVE